jgi:hypothetical protein
MLALTLVPRLPRNARRMLRFLSALLLAHLLLDGTRMNYWRDDRAPNEYFVHGFSSSKKVAVLSWPKDCAPLERRE